MALQVPFQEDTRGFFISLVLNKLPFEAKTEYDHFERGSFENNIV